jgi:hypothetical protein
MRDRAELLKNKIKGYENTGDTQEQDPVADQNDFFLVPHDAVF